MEKIQEIFQQYGQAVFFIELKVDLEERLRRNKTENHLKHKPIKRDLIWSEQDLLETVHHCQVNSQSCPEKLRHYRKLQASHLSARELAEAILRDDLGGKNGDF